MLRLRPAFMALAAVGTALVEGIPATFALPVEPAGKSIRTNCRFSSEPESWSDVGGNVHLLRSVTSRALSTQNPHQSSIDTVSQ